MTNSNSKQNSTELQNHYIDLYKAMRQYIWGLDTVEQLAELEIEVYKSFPNKDALTSKFNALYINIKEQCREDEELDEAANTFKEALEECDEFYAQIDQIREVNVG